MPSLLFPMLPLRGCYDVDVGHNILQMTSNPPLPEKITQLQCFECNQGLQSIFLNWLADSFKFAPNLLARFHHEL